MARSKKSHETGSVITTPSQFGSHASMVVDDPEVLKDFDLNMYKGLGIDAVVCKDDRGYYLTFANRLDSGLADPKRFGR